ncbi:MAG: hypothetical protein FJ276_03450 [Planctomycetes bacterium]|nr:hypothetical protein [Planctomycetota bacterium]
MLFEPPRTAYDLNFHFAGIPVRVHPFFWLAALLLGSGSWGRGGDVNPDAAMQLVVWVVVMFVSILVHELGHSVLIRYFGQVPRIVLYMMGGLAITDSFGSQFGGSSRRTPSSQILISLAGPGAGFLLAGFTVALIVAMGGEFQIDTSGFPFYAWDLPPETSRALQITVALLLYFNIFWGIVNLLPVFPLDGGQVARELFQMSDPRYGLIRSLWLSVITGAAVGVAGWYYLGSVLMPLFFGSLAVSSYMTIKQMTGGGYGGRPW